MFCPLCGHQNPETHRYCGMCGGKLPDANSLRREETETGERDAPDEASHPLVSERPDAPVRHVPPPVPRMPPQRAADRPSTPAVIAGAGNAQHARYRAAEPSEQPRYEPHVVRERATVDERAPIAGPSFLGLNEPATASDSDLLDELDEPRRSHGWRILLVLLVLLVVGVLLALQFRSVAEWKEWGSRLVGELSSNPAPAQPAQPAENVDASPSEETGAPAGQPQELPAAGESNPAEASTEAAKSADQPPVAEEAKEEPKEDARNEPAPATAGRAAKKAEQAPPEEEEEEEPEVVVRRPNESREVARSAPASAPGASEVEQARRAGGAVAARLLWQAVSKGNSEAPVLLADMYLRGNGVPRDCDQALVLLQGAARKPNAVARAALAQLYESGQCVKQDRLAAYALLNSALSVDPYNQTLDRARDTLWARMTTEERQRAQRSEASRD